ncbi:MAG: aminotransferase class I/II-fold pyridoxal phosphate-dependent enzyme [Dehalobacterium sp.]
MTEIQQQTAPLVEQLLKYQTNGYQPFHMPGHKGGFGILKEWHDFLGKEVFSLDLTEVEGLDDLHQPTGPIYQAQKLAADLMEAESAFFLVNGVTVGLHALIMSLCGPGDLIILPRHAHRSIYEAVILSGAKPIYLKPEIDKEWGIPVGVGVGQVETALKCNQDAKCLVMVHPTYQGLVSDLTAIGKAARAHGVPLVVDEAHGAHFKFSPYFPLPALQCGASASVQGWHKTMGSLTQSGMLLVKDKSPGIEDYLTLLQSTSPSYLLMGSLDAARKQWAQSGFAMAEKMVKISWDLRNKVHDLEGVFFLDGETLNSPVLSGLDPTKLLLNARNLGLNGFELAAELRQKYHIQPEMASLKGVLLMVTIGDNKERMEHLFAALRDLVSRFPLGKKAGYLKWDQFDDVEMVLLPGEAIKSPKRTVSLAEAKDCISGEFICPYPPGIPLVVPGEKISGEVLETVYQIKRWGGHIQGPKDPLGNTLRIID